MCLFPLSLCMFCQPGRRLFTERGSTTRLYALPGIQLSWLSVQWMLMRQKQRRMRSVDFCHATVDPSIKNVKLFGFLEVSLCTRSYGILNVLLHYTCRTQEGAVAHETKSYFCVTFTWQLCYVFGVPAAWDWKLIPNWSILKSIV